MVLDLSAKRIYRKFVHFVESRAEYLDNSKVFLSEWIAIFRKKPLYKNIKWDKAQKQEFDSFWKKHYGKIISNRWHKLYQSMNGKFEPTYVPEMIYTTKIEPLMNPYHKTRELEDKSLVELLCSKKLSEQIIIPRTLLVASNGILYNEKREIINKVTAERLLEKLKAAVVKPTIGGSSGNGVFIINNWTTSGKTLDSLLLEYNKNFIIQEKVKPCEELFKLYGGAINTVRITTFITNGEVHHCPIALRMGTGGKDVDNIHAGGIGIYVKDDGLLAEEAYQLGWGDKTVKLKAHPDSLQLFNEYRLPFMPDVIKTAYSLHGCFPGIGIISWDITVDDRNRIVIIEANMKGQGLWFPQIISGKSLFGEYTKDIIDLIRG